MPAPARCPKDGQLHDTYNYQGKTYCSKCGMLISLYPIAPPYQGEPDEKKNDPPKPKN